MSLRDHLQAVYDRHGQLTPELVVNDARDESHPLHGHFEWSDDTAAERWRRHQAQELIRSVKVVYREATEKEAARSVRGFHAVRREDGHVYEPLDKVVADPFARKLVLADMEREWRALRRRYEHFAEFVEMVRADLEDKAA